MNRSFSLRGVFDDLQSISKPLDSSACNKNRPFQCINRLSVYITANRCEQAFFRINQFRSGIENKETACPISILYLSRAIAAMAVKGSLLVSHYALYRNPFG